LPQNAQLSRIRTAAQQALLGKNLDDLIVLLNNLKGAKRQFERARISTESLFDWLKERASELDLQTQLGLNESEFPVVAGQPAALDDALAVEYMARLIDGVMRKAIKQNQARGAG
jgi:hypothetical protein